MIRACWNFMLNICVREIESESERERRRDRDKKAKANTVNANIQSDRKAE
jgi:hypothetical protein